MTGNRMDLTILFGTLAEGMKALAKGVESVAERLDALSKQPEKAEQEQAAKESPGKKTTAAKKRKKGSAKEKKTQAPASERVFALIAENPEGISIEALRETTGYGSKKLHNIVYKLKKQNRVKSEKRGVYKAV